MKRKTPSLFTGFKILIVEDNTPFADTVKEFLTTHCSGLVIEEAEGGSEAMKKVDSLLPDLIIMDIKLRWENGLELTRRIKALHPEMKVIILTSYDMPEYRQAAARVGADYFLTKGSSIREEILKLLESFMR